MLTRRKFLYTAGVTTAGAAVAGSVGFEESKEPQVFRVEVRLPHLPDVFDGFTIAQLSDFHYDQYFSVVPIQKGIELANGLHPDLIVLTGDFVTVPMLDYHRAVARKWAKSAEPCAELLQHLNAPCGRFAVLGNHDGASDPVRVARALQAHQIPLLLNQAVPVERGSARIWLAGIDDVLEGRPDVNRALARVPRGEVTIFLAHEPDFADDVRLAQVDLQLSGHSHGGQIWVPGIGAPWLPQLARKYPRGLYRLGPLTLYTNMGIGTIRMPVRLNCPPEVSLITLRKGAAT